MTDKDTQAVSPDSSGEAQEEKKEELTENTQEAVDKPTTASADTESKDDTQKEEEESVDQSTSPESDSAKEASLPSEAVYTHLHPGMTVKIYQKIKEFTQKGGEKERVQMYEGMILARKHGKEAGATITVRKVVDGVGVEKIFPLNLPSIEKIEVVKEARVRKAKLYFLRNWKKRLKEKRAS